MPKVLHLFRAPKKRIPMEALASATAVADRGFSGCAHARAASKRQLLLVDRETLDANFAHTRTFRTEPSSMMSSKDPEQNRHEPRPNQSSGSMADGRLVNVSPSHGDFGK